MAISETPTEAGTEAGVLVPYEARFARAFATLNYEWIEAYFEVEDEDRLALEDPEGYALRKGGQIYFVVEGDDPVGTVAVVPLKERARPSEQDGKLVYELAKMAVRPDRQGRGYSHLLMRACIDFARAAGADELMLVTNDILKPALGLYNGAGFVPVERYSDTRYERGNLEMRLAL